MEASQFTFEDIEGKIVSFGTPNDTLAMHIKSIKLLCGRYFVFGTIPSGATMNDAGKGVNCAVAVDSVIDFMIFEDESKYIRFMEETN